MAARSRGYAHPEKLAKSSAGSSGHGRSSEGSGAGSGKTREIVGICLLGLGVFSALSLVSMHAGSGTMMGPGGQAMARGLYALAGIGAYFVVAGLLVVAVRFFRGRPLARNFSEVVGSLGLLCAGTMVLYLPFAEESATVPGPGGLIGQWLGQLFGSFVGTVGAVMGAGLLLVISTLILTNISITEVADVVIGVVARALVAGAAAFRGLSKIALAAFPRRQARELGAQNPFEDHQGDDDVEGDWGQGQQEQEDDATFERHGHSTRLALAELEDTLSEEMPAGRAVAVANNVVFDRVGFDRTLRGLPATSPGAAALPSLSRRRSDDESEPVRIGRVPAYVAPDSEDLELDFESALGARGRGGMDDDDGDAHAAQPVADLREEPEVSEEFTQFSQLAALPEAARPRRALSAVIAEVAEVECAALEAADRPEPSQPLVPVVPVIPARAEVPVSTPATRGLGAVAAAAPVIVKPIAAALPTLGLPGGPAGQPVIVAAEPTEAPKKKDDGPGFIRLSEGAFRLPSTDVLEYVPPPAQEIDKKSLYDMAARLEQAMQNYGVKGTVSAINMGPVVTMYEFAPAPGTRTGKIAQLENDLAMALEAQAVRIVAPIPGKAVVGVEVPNKNRQTVYLKEILSDDSFRTSTSKLQIALGKDIQGHPVSVNLAKMPHLLVAGTTGSGKSVTVNGMITSLLYNANPEEVRFIMVDPKMLELSIYEGIPHLLLPVVTDPKKANLALRWAVDEMERRYELLSKTGVRDIASYNAKIDLEEKKKSAVEAVRAAGGAVVASAQKAVKKLQVVIEGPGGEEALPIEDDNTNPGVISEELREEISNAAAAVQAEAEKPKEETPRKLPYIVIVIDEFADLMMVAPKDVETSVARLAQKARAAGLHVILATQRPSVDVITGLIKANFPSRIALQVAGKMDSRVILDQHGAESLLGNGDMLFSDRGTKLRRIHGAFLSDDEVHRVVDFLKAQAKPVYDMDILKPREEDGEGEGGAPVDDFHDPLYDQAVAIVCETRQASVSFIQRRLQIGYNRSARMVEQMERDGIVGPANGIKPREVIAPTGDYLTSAV